MPDVSNTISLLIILLLVDLSLLLSNGASLSQPTVKTKTATLRGKRLKVQSDQLPDLRRSVLAFTRIPYAEPPVGALRYSRPVPKVLEGEFEATRDPIACPQVFLPSWNLNMNTSEDCLYLDVFVPEQNPEQMPQSAAVMVWIHGGGYHMGAGSVPRVLPTPLAALGGVIIVTCNFRIGPLVFLATGDEAIPANLGLLDQRLVLLWVQQNIAAFGGDARRMTVFGMSSGAASINLHLMSPGSAGLFSRAILQSGSVGASWPHHGSMQEAVQMTFDFGRAVGCEAPTSGPLVACLRDKTVDEILAPYSKRTTVVGDFFLRPVADGAFLPDDPRKLAAQGSFNAVDVLIGCMKGEGILSMMLALGDQQTGDDPPFLDQSAYREVIAKYLGTRDPTVLDTAAFVYSKTDQLLKPAQSNFVFSAGKLVGNQMTLCPTFATSEQLSLANLTVYAYLMTHAPSCSVFGGGRHWMGAAHGEDVPYVFGSPLLLPPAADPMVVGGFGDRAEVEISRQIMEYWSNFAKTGNPNLSEVDEAAVDSSYPPWPRFSAADPSYKELSASFENRKGKADTRECHFLYSVLPKLLSTADEINRLKTMLQDGDLITGDQSCDGRNLCP